METTPTPTPTPSTGGGDTIVKIDITPMVDQQKITNDYLFLGNILLFAILVFSMFRFALKGLWK